MSLSISLRHRFEYAGFMAVDRLFSRMTLEVASARSGALWRALAPLLSRHQRVLAHLSMAFPDMPAARRETIARDMWEVLGRVFGESFHLPALAGPDRLALDDEAFWRAQIRRRNGRGYVVCAPHLANWEIAAPVLNRLGLHTAGLYQGLTNPLVDRRVQSLRAFAYPGGLYAKKPSATRALIRHVKDGGTLAMLADLRDSSGIRVPFFGISAKATRFPAMLARLYDVPMLAGRITRLPDAHFRGALVEIPVPRTQDAEADIYEATQALQKTFEDWIRATPEQWMWGHRRWD
jgi:KDO2-lipid IV(A) lauroyltransferase